MKTRKGNFSVLLVMFLIGVGFVACENNDDISAPDVSGVYEGTLTDNLEAKSYNTVSSKSAVAYIDMIGNEIRLHCVSEDFDETVMLNYYRHNDSLMVCLTGADFERTYGHRLGSGNMNGGHMMNGNSEWANHMYREHHEGDEHFGGFNMQNHSFEYTFHLNHGLFHFEGLRKN